MAISSRRVAALALVALAVGTGACVPPVEVTTTPAHFNPETVMGEIQARGFLKIGVPSDRPPFGSQSGRLDDVEGATVELGRYVAEALHVDPSFVAAPNDELLGLIDDKSVDVAFPITAITEPLVRHYSFTDPYWVAHQRLLSLRGTFDLDELGGETVCSFIDPDTEVALDTLNPAIELKTVPDPADCVPTVEKNGVATASDAILMGMVEALHRRVPIYPPIIGGDELTTEGYGAVVIGDAPGFIEVVNNILARAQEDGTWDDAVGGSVAAGGQFTTPAEPPDLTVEEAAALYPTGT